MCVISQIHSLDIYDTPYVATFHWISHDAHVFLLFDDYMTFSWIAFNIAWIWLREKWNCNERKICANRVTSSEKCRQFTDKLSKYRSNRNTLIYEWGNVNFSLWWFCPSEHSWNRCHGTTSSVENNSKPSYGLKNTEYYIEFLSHSLRTQQSLAIISNIHFLNIQCAKDNKLTNISYVQFLSQSVTYQLIQETIGKRSYRRPYNLLVWPPDEGTVPQKWEKQRKNSDFQAKHKPKYYVRAEQYRRLFGFPSEVIRWSFRLSTKTLLILTTHNRTQRATQWERMKSFRLGFPFKCFFLINNSNNNENN